MRKRRESGTRVRIKNAWRQENIVFYCFQPYIQRSLTVRLMKFFLFSSLLGKMNSLNPYRYHRLNDTKPYPKGHPPLIKFTGSYFYDSLFLSLKPYIKKLFFKYVLFYTSGCFWQEGILNLPKCFFLSCKVRKRHWKEFQHKYNKRYFYIFLQILNSLTS